MDELTEKDIDFIKESLNETWYNATRKLERKDLGDIDRQNTLFAQQRAKELLEKLGGL